MRLVLALGLALSPTLPAGALDDLTFSLPGNDKKMMRAVRGASLLAGAEAERVQDPLDLLAAARADYGRILSALYAQGYYAGTISIRIDGREAAEIGPSDVPGKIGQIEVRVEPGPRFRFSAARMKPYAPGTQLPSDYRDGQPAYSTAIQDAAGAGIAGWRALGHAKAAVAGQEITADHAAGSVASTILLSAGPRLSFGALHLNGQERMKAHRIAKIAGYREGLRFDPALVDRMVTRLRRTGIFRSVVVREADEPNPDGTLDMILEVQEEAPRRLGFGAEYASADGGKLSAFWLHRNLFGGGERLRIEGLVEGVGGQDDIVGYEIGARIERPGTPFTDSSVFAEMNFGQADILDAEIRALSFGVGATRVITDRLKAEAGLSYITASVEDPLGRQTFRVLALPVELEWDRRDDKLDPTRGSYMTFGGTPFLGFGTADTGTQLKAEVRAYRGFGAEGRVVLAGRAQIGTTVGTSLLNTAPDYLFQSGGAGTVRGHPFQSLGVTAGGVDMGGLSFAAFSAEVRAEVADRIGVVAFYDTGFVSDQEWFGGTGAWQAGAGVGIRYDTGFGPVRLDVAFPVSGQTGDGMQVYVGIGQSF